MGMSSYVMDCDEKRFEEIYQEELIAFHEGPEMGEMGWHKRDHQDYIEDLCTERAQARMDDEKGLAQ